MAMTEREVKYLAETLMMEHGLVHPQWVFRTGRGKNAIGFCQWWSKSRGGDGIGQIVYSKNYLHLPDHQIKDTILHEIAHALAGPKAGHNNEWKKVCRRIGAMPKACADLSSDEKLVPKWTGVCPNNFNHKITREQLTKKGRSLACARCCKELNQGRFDARYLFEWHLTEDLKSSGRSGVRIINLPEQQAQIPTRVSELMAAMRVNGD